MRGLPLTLQILRDVHEVLGLIQSSLGGGIFALRDHHSVIIFRYGHYQPAARNFSLGVGQCFRRFGTGISRSHEKARGKVLVVYAPGAVYVDAILRYESTVGNFSAISLIVEVLRRGSDSRQHGV